METPYAYNYAGLHDRICEIVDAEHKYMFTSGRGGLPGNNDSGGLSSCYIWNACGIFPVTGQDLMIAGAPRYKAVTLHLANGNNLIIEREGAGIYTKSVYFNGKELAGFTFKASEMMKGGTVKFIMNDK